MFLYAVATPLRGSYALTNITSTPTVPLRPSPRVVQLPVAPVAVPLHGSARELLLLSNPKASSPTYPAPHPEQIQPAALGPQPLGCVSSLDREVVQALQGHARRPESRC